MKPQKVGRVMTMRRASLLVWMAVFGTASPALAQGTPAPVPAPTPAPAARAQTPPATPTGSLTRAELEELLGPIALYPDDLLASVLAASVYPDEVREAAAAVRNGINDKSIEAKTWEAPVKSVAKLPDVVKMMGEYSDWTTALGQAYLTQSADVMAAVQALRKKAQANGALQTTPQQTVVVEKETVYIQPTDPEVIYVPSYSPSVVYVDDDDDDVVAAGLIGFGAGVVMGAVWADVACDWNHGCVGWGNADIDIDRNFNGDINIGNTVGSGNRVQSGNRIGKEGGAWSPNQNKALATSRPNQLQNYRGTGAGQGAAGARATPRASSTRALSPAQTPASRQAGARSGNAARPTSGAAPRATPQAGARTPAAPPRATANAAAGGRTQAPASARNTPAARTPSADRGQSAFRGGSDTRASASRGAASRQSASRSSGGSRGGGGGRGGGRR